MSGPEIDTFYNADGKNIADLGGKSTRDEIYCSYCPETRTNINASRLVPLLGEPLGTGYLILGPFVQFVLDLDHGCSCIFKRALE